jgi:hypothetical protein
MQAIFRRNSTDPEMMEILTKDEEGNYILWAVAHSEFLLQSPCDPVEQCYNLDGIVKVEITTKDTPCY